MRLKLFARTILLILCFYDSFLFSLWRDEYTLRTREYELNPGSGPCISCAKIILKYEDENYVPVKNYMLQILDKYGHLIPKQHSNWHGDHCLFCDKKPITVIYKGYFDKYRNRYLDQFERYLEFVSLYPDCTCFWPESSNQAAHINDIAYNLFYSLLAKTEIGTITENGFECPREKYDNFFQIQPQGRDFWGYFRRDATIVFVNHSFFFSDYIRICQDLYLYSIRNFNKSECEKIKESLDCILEILAPHFLNLYDCCLKNFINNEFILKEVINLKNYLKDDLIDDYCMLQYFKALENINSNIGIDSFDKLQSKAYILPSPNFHESNFLLTKGTFLNDMLLYHDAIKTLTESIKANQNNREAYIERALAYFETNQIDLAIHDYKKAKELIFNPYRTKSESPIPQEKLYVPEDKIEFSKGLVNGTLEGGKVSTIEFLPSIFSCYCGIFKGLWSFVCSPNEVSREMIDSAYAVGEFISLHTTNECIECVVPELRELSYTWKELNDNARGHKIGYIIGKYGVDIFAPIGIFKGVAKIQALRRANTMLTIESCVSSQAKKAKILEESGKLAAKRQVLISEISNKGTIYSKNANAIPHILQEKHAWEKVTTIKHPIKANLNIEENFKSVIRLLEKEKISANEYFTETMFSNATIKVNKHSKVINGQTVEAVFEINTETNTILLQDAWVVTREIL